MAGLAWLHGAKNAQARARLASIRQSIEDEAVSYSELAELADLAEYIDPSDVLLLEWAGVPEFAEGDDPEHPLVIGGLPICSSKCRCT